MYNKNGTEGDPYIENRDKAYQDMFDKIGNSKENIKIIHNFMPEFVCKTILENLGEAKGGWGDQWSGKAFQNEKLFEIISPFAESIKENIEKLYKAKIEQISRGVVIKWYPGDSMGIHIDDWGVENYEITGVIYINDEYVGGEISFPTQDVIVKPKRGDLVMFPGNLHYAHEVREILSGERYTIPVWFRFIENEMVS
jgi:hypothetical protein